MTEEERAEIRRIRESCDSDPDGLAAEALLPVMLKELERQRNEERLKAELARKRTPIHVNPV